MSYSINAFPASAEALNGRAILVTGAGSGIGRAVSIALGKAGATVILLGRTTRKLEKVYDEIEAAGGAKPAIYPLNLEGAVYKDYEDLAAVCDREFGRLDGLLHNATVTGRHAPMALCSPQDWVKVMHVNLTAMLMLTQACIPVMEKSDDASLVMSMDSVAERGDAYWGPYAVAKSGVHTFARVMAQEHETNSALRVNAIDPGPVATALRATVFPSEEPETLAQPEDVVQGYLYLLGRDSKDLNGELLRAQA